MEGLGSECSFYDFLLNKSLQTHSLRNLHGAVNQNDNLPLHLNIKAAEVRNEVGTDMNPLDIIASKKIQVIVLPSADRIMRQATHPQKIDWRAFAQEKDFKEVVERTKKEQYADDCVVTSQGSKTDRKSTSYQRQQEKLQNQKKIWTTENKLKFVMAEKIGFGEIQKLHRRFLTQKMKSSFQEERGQNVKLGGTKKDEDYTPSKSDQESFPQESQEDKSLSLQDHNVKIASKIDSNILDNKTIQEEEEPNVNVSLFDRNIFFSEKELEMQQKWEENNPCERLQQLHVISEGQEKVFIDAVCKKEKFQLVDLFPSERMQHEVRRVPLKDVELNDFDRQKFELNKKIEEKRQKIEENKHKTVGRFRQKIVREDIGKLHQDESTQNISIINQIPEPGSNEIANHHSLDIAQIPLQQQINSSRESSNISKIVTNQQLKQQKLRKRRQENAISLKRLMKDSESNSLLYLREKCIGSMDINLHSTFQQLSGGSKQQQDRYFGRSKSGELLKQKEEMSAYSKITQTERRSLGAAIEQLESFKLNKVSKNYIQDFKSTRNNSQELLILPIVSETQKLNKKNSLLSNYTDRPCISVSKRNCSPFLKSINNFNNSLSSTPLCTSRIESSMTTPLKSLKSLECNTERQGQEINRFQIQKDIFENQKFKKPLLKIETNHTNQAYIDFKKNELLRDTKSVSKLDSDNQKANQDKIVQIIREPYIKPADSKLKNFKDSLRIKECFYDFYGKCVKSQKKATTDSEKMEKKIVKEVKRIDKCLEKMQNNQGKDISNFQEEFKNFKEIKIFKRRLFNFVVNAVQPEDRQQIFEKYSMTHRKEVEEAFSHQLQR